MKVRYVLGLSIWLLAGASPANACQCSALEAQTAERTSATLTSWQSIYAAHTRFGHCDDGAIAEGFTESVVHLLAARWSSLHEAQSLIAQDPSFQQFIIRHINASADTAELNRVAAMASQQCPVSATHLCKQIHEATLEQ